MEKDIMAELGMLSDEDEDEESSEEEDEDLEHNVEDDEDVLEDITDEAAIEELRKEVEAAVNFVESKQSDLKIPNLAPEETNLGPEHESEGEEDEDDQIEDLKDFNSRYKPFRDGQPRARQVSSY